MIRKNLRKKMVSIVLVMLMVVSMVACGSETSTTSNEATIDGSTSSGSDTVASIENSSSIETQDVVAVEETNKAKEETEDPEYEEYEYFYKDKNFVWEGEIILDYKSSNPTDNMVEFEDVEDLEMYGLYDSLDTYAGTGVVNGYTKPNIVVQLRATSDDWVLVTFESDGSTYLKRKDFEGNSVLVTDMDGSGNYIIPERGSTTTSSETTSTNNGTSSNETTTSKETNTSANTTTNETSSNVSNPTPIANEVETQVVEVDDKYTPEEAVAVWRGILEANGMTWDPSIKDWASWGTGWLELKKGKPEEAAQMDLKGYAYGDGTGNPKTIYYAEITGYDDNKVYMTSWSSTD